VAGSRLLLQAGIYDEFLGRLIERAGAIVVGHPLAADTMMGPITTRAQYDTIQSHLFDASEQGATRAFRGELSASCRPEGLYVPPTIFTGVSAAMRVWREEVFGPVLAVMRFETEAEALSAANDSPFGLAAGLWTRDLNRALRLHKELESGTVWINSYRGVSSMTPLGGFKKSGFGRENGQEVLYVTERAVFRRGADGLELIELAPGIDLERDVIAHMGFRPRIADDLKVMDARLFMEEPMGLGADLHRRPARAGSPRLAELGAAS
jgi:acyl-CoA reductase-like NAD-dependent aldehyde dehydrogenase